jgi:hypothetical protein
MTVRKLKHMCACTGSNVYVHVCVCTGSSVYVQVCMYRQEAHTQADSRRHMQTVSVMLTVSVMQPPVLYCSDILCCLLVAPKGFVGATYVGGAERVCWCHLRWWRRKGLLVPPTLVSPVNRG